MMKSESSHLTNFVFEESQNLFSQEPNTRFDFVKIEDENIPRYTNEFWTSKQRQASTLHEISYRACFKPQLPKFFIELTTTQNDAVYDPFSGRGTTAVESALLGRNVVSNDINPLSKILIKARLEPPTLEEVSQRLDSIIFYDTKADTDLTMFYDSKTEAEIVSLKNYLAEKNNPDFIDNWIRMVATNRLTGHSSGFFSVYTLPPNLAATQKRQIKINAKYNQVPEYRNVKNIIIKKTKQLVGGLTLQQKNNLNKAAERAIFITDFADKTKSIKANSIRLTVTSPPFLNIVDYATDNWLRCWFNNIEAKEISKKITVLANINDWCDYMKNVLDELYRITQIGGFVAFEVGELQNGKIKLDEYIVPLGVSAGFVCECIVVNEQNFTKTSNIWGIKNNSSGTNTNRIVVFRKNHFTIHEK